MIGRSLPAGCPAAAVLATIDRRFVLHAVLWATASLLAFGLAAAIIPNPAFGRQVPPEPFAIVVWLVSAPLMGLLGATYSAPAPSGPVAEPVPLAVRPAAGVAGRDGTVLGTAASFGAFLAIGCPVCRDGRSLRPLGENPGGPAHQPDWCGDRRARLTVPSGRRLHCTIGRPLRTHAPVPPVTDTVPSNPWSSR